MLVRHKDVEINDRRWRLGLVPADAGVWIFMQLQADMKCSDFEIYSKIKDFLFSAIAIYVEESGVSIPKAIYAKGRWLAPELELDYDTATVNALFFAALDFNVSPFAKPSSKT